MYQRATLPTNGFQSLESNYIISWNFLRMALFVVKKVMVHVFAPGGSPKFCIRDINKRASDNKGEKGSGCTEHPAATFLHSDPDTNIASSLRRKRINSP